MGILDVDAENGMPWVRNEQRFALHHDHHLPPVPADFFGGGHPELANQLQRTLALQDVDRVRFFAASPLWDKQERDARAIGKDVGDALIEAPPMTRPSRTVGVAHTAGRQL